VKTTLDLSDWLKAAKQTAQRKDLLTYRSIAEVIAKQLPPLKNPPKVERIIKHLNQALSGHRQIEHVTWRLTVARFARALEEAVENAGVKQDLRRELLAKLYGRSETVEDEPQAWQTLVKDGIRHRKELIGGLLATLEWFDYVLQIDGDQGSLRKLVFTSTSVHGWLEDDTDRRRFRRAVAELLARHHKVLRFAADLRIDLPPISAVSRQVVDPQDPVWRRNSALFDFLLAVVHSGAEQLNITAYASARTVTDPSKEPRFVREFLTLERTGGLLAVATLPEEAPGRERIATNDKVPPSDAINEAMALPSSSAAGTLLRLHDRFGSRNSARSLLPDEHPLVFYTQGLNNRYNAYYDKLRDLELNAPHGLIGLHRTFSDRTRPNTYFCTHPAHVDALGTFEEYSMSYETQWFTYCLDRFRRGLEYVNRGTKRQRDDLAHRLATDHHRIQWARRAAFLQAMAAPKEGRGVRFIDLVPEHTLQRFRDIQRMTGFTFSAPENRLDRLREVLRLLRHESGVYEVVFVPEAKLEEAGFGARFVPEQSAPSITGRDPFNTSVFTPLTEASIYASSQEKLNSIEPRSVPDTSRFHWLALEHDAQNRDSLEHRLILCRLEDDQMAQIARQRLLHLYQASRANANDAIEQLEETCKYLERHLQSLG
jgi:hypothetical protein